MSDHLDRFDATEVAEAERLDLAIDAIAETSDPVLRAVAVAMQVDVPSRVMATVAGAVARPARQAWRRVQVSAAALALVFAFHGAGNLFNGRWVAENLHEPYGSHAFVEGGFALVAVAIAIAAGAVRREWSPVAVAAGAPMGIFLGVQGGLEAHEFAGGAALHFTEGALAVALLACWWAARRYARRGNGEYPA
jgi:hypothetical protein